MASTLSVLSADPARDAPLVDYLRRAGWAVETDAVDADVVLVLDPSGLDNEAEDALLAAGRPVLLVGPMMSTALTDAAGLLPSGLTPAHETRVRPGPDAGDVAARLGGDLLVHEAWPLQDKVADDVEVLLTANVAFTDHAVATWRSSRDLGVLTVGSTAQTLADPLWQRVVHRLLRKAVGAADGAPVRVGILGYGAIGHEHNAAIARTLGLELTAVCDPNPLRVEAARELAPGVRGHATGERLLADPEVDLVIVSTPPDTHADWALRCLEAGKHVVVEKPFCLTVEEADRQIAAAAERGLTLAVYQNRRWDPDYLALKAVIRSGQLGEVFHYESFIGGYGHPCNYWHSDEGRQRRRDLRLGKPLPRLGPRPVLRRRRVGLGDHAQAGLARRHQRRPQPGADPLRRWRRGGVHPLRPRGRDQAEVLRPGDPGRAHRVTGGRRRSSPGRRSAPCSRTALPSPTAPPTCGCSPLTAQVARPRRG